MKSFSLHLVWKKKSFKKNKKWWSPFHRTDRKGRQLICPSFGFQLYLFLFQHLRRFATPTSHSLSPCSRWAFWCTRGVRPLPPLRRRYGLAQNGFFCFVFCHSFSFVHFNRSHSLFLPTASLSSLMGTKELLEP